MGASVRVANAAGLLVSLGFVGDSRTVVLVVGTVLTGAGLALVVWRELGSAERRVVGRVRDTIEVALPIVAGLSLLVWVWAAR
jgi:hypothetical protein